MIKSKRGLPLAISCDLDLLERPLITVEVYSKWYYLHVVRVGHPVGEIGFETLDEMHLDGYGPPFVDHAPNPWHVMEYARRIGADVDDIALELIIGRWELECGEGRYDELWGSE